VLTPVERRPARSRLEARRTVQRPVVRLITFAGLGFYAVVRWGSLLNPAPTGRLLGLLAVSVGLAVAGTVLRGRLRPLVIAAAILAVLAIFPLSGVPFTWVRHVRIAVTANWIDQGLSFLPRVLVPYAGINEWVRIVMLLGAGVLLLDAGLLLAFSPPVPGDLRRAGVALPLIALAVVPSTLVRPQHPYLQGLVLFGLLVLFIWGERVARPEVAGALVLCVVAAGGALLIAPTLDRHSPWINPTTLIGVSSVNVDRFNWAQTYRPLNWPRHGHAVIYVKAPRSSYWKAENLVAFDGYGWATGQDPGDELFPGGGGAPDSTSSKTWTEQIQVTISAMKSFNVIGAGVMTSIPDVPGGAYSSVGVGTYTTPTELGPGDTYKVTTYVPDPTPRQLATAGAAYPPSTPGYGSVTLPEVRRAGLLIPAATLTFPPFHTTLPIESSLTPSTADTNEIMQLSPYAPAIRLAERLAKRSATPYAFVQAVMGYLSRGFSYDENPVPNPYPLESFLFTDKAGYCQQFAGAMALLLRIGGLPARVAVGFTSGTYDTATQRFIVSDIDAHAWVEVWFPHYGWVTFDPTPTAAPARGGKVAPAARQPENLGVVRGRGEQPHAAQNQADFPPVAHHASAASHVALYVAIAAILALLAAGAFVTRPRGPGSGEEMLRELERAMARSGRPIGPGVTLAGLEQRFSASPDAVAYVRAIRLARFAGGTELLPQSGRGAVRGELRAGLGLLGRLRALWALPPRWKMPGRGIHSSNG
jgi:transglutaminase-like putative cysteine protease